MNVFLSVFALFYITPCVFTSVVFFCFSSHWTQRYRYDGTHNKLQPISKKLIILTKQEVNARTRHYLTLLWSAPACLRLHQHSWNELVYTILGKRNNWFASACMEPFCSWPWSSPGLMWAELLTFTSDTLQLNIGAKNKSIKWILHCQQRFWCFNYIHVFVGSRLRGLYLKPDLIDQLFFLWFTFSVILLYCCLAKLPPYFRTVE